MSEARLAGHSDLSEAYDRDGVAVVRRMLLPSIIRDLESGWQIMKSAVADGTVDRESRFLWGVLPEPFGSLFRNDSLVRAAQSLLRTPNLALYLNRILLKDSDWSGA
ncbi:MAG TPA: hypothetical protein VET85_12130, partial [Stellaceae bacterium]|nr:hypothetical protein [Stellaceae bacterium]